jgi:hypothetical protein
MQKLYLITIYFVLIFIFTVCYDDLIHKYYGDYFYKKDII